MSELCPPTHKWPLADFPIQLTQPRSPLIGWNTRYPLNHLNHDADLRAHQILGKGQCWNPSPPLSHHTPFVADHRHVYSIVQILPLSETQTQGPGSCFTSLNVHVVIDALVFAGNLSAPLEENGYL